MNKTIVILIVLISTLGFSFTQQKPTPGSKVEIYYFHGKKRCPTCVSIEENTLKTINTYFKTEKAQGIVKMLVIDIDDKKNEALVEKYEVSSSSLYVTRLSGGKTFTTDLTNFAFSYSRTNPTKFMTGLKDKITESLKK